MKAKELTISLSRKINAGNYESKGIIIGATVSLDENEDLLQAKQELAGKLKQFLEAEVKQAKGASE